MTSPAQDGKFEGIPVAKLAKEHGRDPADVVKALLPEWGLLVATETAKRLSGEWQAEDEKRSEVERSRVALQAQRQERQRTYDSGRALLAALTARRFDLRVTAQQLERTSLDIEVAALERRQELEVEDCRAALERWTAWKEQHAELAHAIEAVEAPAAPQQTGVGGLAGYRPPDWREEGVW